MREPLNNKPPRSANQDPTRSSNTNQQRSYNVTPTVPNSNLPSNRQRSSLDTTQPHHYARPTPQNPTPSNRTSGPPPPVMRPLLPRDIPIQYETFPRREEQESASIYRKRRDVARGEVALKIFYLVVFLCVAIPAGFLLYYAIALWEFAHNYKF